MTETNQAIAEKQFFCPPRHNDRTAGALALLTAEAETPKEAELAAKDLYEKGYAIMRDGKRFDPPAPTPPVVIWDEVPLHD